MEKNTTLLDFKKLSLVFPLLPLEPIVRKWIYLPCRSLHDLFFTFSRVIDREKLSFEWFRYGKDSLIHHRELRGIAFFHVLKNDFEFKRMPEFIQSATQIYFQCYIMKSPSTAFNLYIVPYNPEKYDEIKYLYKNYIFDPLRYAIQWVDKMTIGGKAYIEHGGYETRMKGYMVTHGFDIIEYGKSYDTLLKTEIQENKKYFYL